MVWFGFVSFGWREAPRVRKRGKEGEREGGWVFPFFVFFLAAERSKSRRAFETRCYRHLAQYLSAFYYGYGRDLLASRQAEKQRETVDSGRQGRGKHHPSDRPPRSQTENSKEKENTHSLLRGSHCWISFLCRLRGPPSQPVRGNGLNDDGMSE